MTKLLACPFCGGVGHILHMANGYYKVICDQCETEGPIKMSREMAAEAWNHRKGDQ